MDTVIEGSFMAKKTKSKISRLGAYILISDLQFKKCVHKINNIFFISF